jgi:hypothetical protein
MIKQGINKQNRYFLGNKQVSSIYLGKTFIQGKEEDAPSHTELEYLITNKNNPVRIDTGYYLKDNTIIKVKAKWDSNYVYLAHTEDGNVNSNYFFVRYGSSTREFYFRVYPKREWTSDRGYYSTSPHSVEFGRYKVYIDDSLKYNGDLGQISDWSYPIILFGEQTNFKGNFNLYYFQIFEGETLVKSFKPVIDSEGVVCLYEEVNKQYYYTSIGSFGHS